MPNRLLLADEDPQTSQVLEVSLRAAGFDVTTVATGAAAWVALEEGLPQVIIAATNLAALDGFELCTRVRAREGGRNVAFILLGRDDSLAYRIKSIEAGADDYLLEPLYVQEVVARVRTLVQRRDRETFTSSARAAEAFAGNLADLSVVDLLQLIAEGGRSGIVHLRGARETPATVYFRQGRVVDAEVGRLSGLNAISRLFSWPAGTFEVQWKPIRRPDVIGLPTPELVLEGMKRLDARNRLAGGLPDLNAVFEVNYRVLAERLSEIPDEVNTVLRLFDGARTLAHVVDDCQLPDAEAMAIAIRLRDEGIIHNVSRPEGEMGSSLEVPPGRPAARPGEDDVTVVRRITSLGLGSGPVQQAFTASVASGATATSADTVLMRSPFDDVDGVVSPPNHAKTDPGLGNPLDRLDLDLPSRPSESAPNETGSALPAGAAAAIEAQDTVPHDLSAATASAARSDLDMDVSSLQTQRGLGPFPDLVGTLEETQPPVLLDPQPDLASASEDELAQAIAGLADPSPPDALSETGLHREGASATSANEVSPPLAAPPPSPSPASQETARIDALPDEPSAQEELDELALPRRKWGGTAVAVLGVAVAVAAIAIYKLRAGGAGAGAAPVAAPVAQASTQAPPGVPGPAPLAGEPTPAPAAAAVAPSPPAPAPAASAKSPAEPAVAGYEAAPVPAGKPSPRNEGNSATAEVAGPAGTEKTKAVSPEPSGDKAQPGPAAPAKSSAAEVKPDAPDALAPSAAPPADFARQLATCRTQFLRNRFHEAATTCAAALEANPSSADALTMMAHVELNRGRLARANDLAQKSIAIDPNQADAYVIIGGVHQDSGRNAQAKVAYRRYLQLAPHGRYADELRSIVGSL